MNPTLFAIHTLPPLAPGHPVLGATHCVTLPDLELYGKKSSVFQPSECQRVVSHQQRTFKSYKTVSPSLPPPLPYHKGALYYISIIGKPYVSPQR